MESNNGIKRGTIVLIITCVIIVVVGIISMPQIYKLLNTSKVDISDNNINKKDTDTKEEINMDSEIVATLVYPVMHNDVSISDNYYKNNGIKVSDLSNNDILYNAFLNIYPGYISVSDTTSFDSNYLVSRIENIFGPKTGYNLVDFTVPNGSFSDYVGVFHFDDSTKRYIFNKTDNNNGVVYYDVKKMYDASSPNENTIITSFDIAFVKIEDNRYTLYKDYNYTDEISSGEFTSMENLENMLSTLDTNKYQYTFRKDTCNYDSYCFYEGKWLNE